jgi:Cu-Zn family superoxide dismutase
MNLRVRPLIPLIAIATPLLLVAACESVSLTPGATAQLRATTGNVASGTVHFVQRGSMVRVSGEVRGLKPNAEHGFHIHEKGDCSSGDGMSAGGHFNPDGKPHGQYGQGSHHAGDLPSLKADGNGVARINFEASTISLEGGPTNIVGKGLIVHRDPDDYRTQPTGNSGPRLACGLIAAT